MGNSKLLRTTLRIEILELIHFVVKNKALPGWARFCTGDKHEYSVLFPNVIFSLLQLEIISKEYYNKM